MGSYIKAMFFLIVLVVLVTFGIKNNETMVLHSYFQWSSPPVPVYAVVYGSLILGILIGMLVGINSRFSQRKKLKAAQKESRDLKAKVAEVSEEKPDESTEEEKETPQEETQEIKDAPEANNEEDEDEEEEEAQKENRF